ncbi:MAG: TetR/AcrR family transcriptional regulator, partial [Thermomicrobiales bacterium]
RETILDEAGRLLREKGPSAVSMRAIARELGYSPAALYEYFPGIDDILAALYFEGVDGLDGRMRNALSGLDPHIPAIDEILELGRAYRTYAHSQPELFRLQFSENKPSPKAHEMDGTRPGYGLLVHAIEKALAAGEIIDGPVQVLAVHCWSAVHGFVALENSSHIQAENNDELFELMLQFVKRALTKA